MSEQPVSTAIPNSDTPVNEEQKIPISMVDQIIKDMQLTLQIRRDAVAFALQLAPQNADQVVEAAKKFEDYFSS